MNSFCVFTIKELKEQIKTFKGIVVAVILLIFGMTSPLMAKLTPDIIKMANIGIEIKIPAPTYIDAYTQFFKNISQIVFIVIILVYSGSIVSETSKGTALLMLTKRLSRKAFLLSKFVSAAIVWTISYAASAALCIVYTNYLFPQESPKHLFMALFCMWFFGIITVAISIFSSSLFNNYAIAAVGGFCLWGLMLVTSSIPKIKKYTPSLLGTSNMQLLTGNTSISSIKVPFLLGALFIVLLLVLTSIIFRKREI